MSYKKSVAIKKTKMASFTFTPSPNKNDGKTPPPKHEPQPIKRRRSSPIVPMKLNFAENAPAFPAQKACSLTQLRQKGPRPTRRKTDIKVEPAIARLMGDGKPRCLEVKKDDKKPRRVVVLKFFIHSHC